MKMTDIVIGEEYVCIENSWSTAFKVKILKTKQPRYSYNSGNYRKDGILVEQDRYGYGVREETVIARHIKSTWAEHEANQKVKDDRQRVEKAERAIEAFRAENLFHGFVDYLRLQGFTGVVTEGSGRNLWWSSTGIGISLNLAEQFLAH